MTPQTHLEAFQTAGIFPSHRCPCDADGVPSTQPYCDECLARLRELAGPPLRSGGEAR